VASGTMAVVRTVADLRATVRSWRAQGGATVGLVPTMGALHDGHLSLVRAARTRCDRVVTTLFVNPKQFNRPDDLAAYPRTEASDAALLESAGVDALFAPSVDQMYPPGFATTVTVTGVGTGLCGAARPGHFDGVATVVTKLLLQAQPDAAFFGEKDYQQLQVIRRFTADLDIPVDIVGCPTVRAADGLALSSRNAHLGPAERRIAPALHATLARTAARLERGEPAAAALADGIAAICAAGFASVDYLELRAANGLDPLERAERPGRLLAAAWLGKTRLIDNVPVAAAGR